MPRSLDPRSRLTLVLASDLDKPADVQPRIYARTLTLNQQRQLMVALERLKGNDATAKLDAAIDAAMICLSGWERMIDPETGDEIPFSRETIGDVLSIEELGEIFEAVTSAVTLSADDKKKSE